MSHTEQKGWRSLVDYDELLLNADGLMDDETRALKMQAIIGKTVEVALSSYQEELVKKIVAAKLTENTCNDTPSSAYNDETIANDSFNRGLSFALALIKDTKI